jgi:hypothetical protein
MAGPKAYLAIFVAASAGMTGVILGGPVGWLAGIAGALAAPLFGSDPWMILAALAIGNMLWMSNRTRYGLIPAVAGMRLWTLSAPLHLIAGVCFILAGLATFVEEAPETRIRGFGGGPAIMILIIGVLMTSFGHSAPAPVLQFAWTPAVPAVLFGLLFAIVTGLPAWNYRFLRSSTG